MKFTHLKVASLYVLFNALNGAIPFFLLPILTTYLSPADFGTLSLFQTTVAALIPIVGLSLGFKIDNQYFKVSRNAIGILIFNIVCILMSMILITTGALYIFSIFDNHDLLNLPIGWILVLPVVSGMTCITSFNLILLRNQNRALKYGLWQVGLTTINLSLSLLFVISLMLGWEGRALGILSANFILGVLSILNMYKTGYLILIFDKQVITEVLRFCVPLLFNGVAIFIIFQSNIYIINYFLDTSSVGIYSVALSFAAITGLIKEGIVKTFNPWLYRVLSEKNENFNSAILRNILMIAVILIILAFVVNYFASYLIVYMVDSRFITAKDLILVLCLSVSVNGIYNVLAPFFIHYSQTKALSTVSVITGFFSLGINYLLVPKYGVSGAANSLLLALAFQLILTIGALVTSKKILIYK
jgi:O-antigen/teichoic acid export membrane protein